MPRHAPRSATPVARILVALLVLVALALAAPVAADDTRYPDAITRGDPYLGSNVQPGGSSAPKNAGNDPMPFTGNIVGGCVVGLSASGVLAYQRTIYTAIRAGYAEETHSYTDVGCTVPLTP